MHDPHLTDNPPSPANGRTRSRPVDFQQPCNNKSHPDIVRFIERVRALTDSYDERFTVAEVGGEDSEPAMKAFTAGASRFHTAYGFNFLYADALSPQLVRAATEAWPADGNSAWPSWAFCNHDAPRAVSRWAEPADRRACARAAMLLLVSLRGNIFLYQGEELGLPQATLAFADLKDPEAITNWPQILGRDGARTPMPWAAHAANGGFSNGRPWLPVAESHLPLAVDRQEAEPNSQLALARRLIALRNRFPALRSGTMRIIEAGAEILVFQRAHAAEELLCAFNFGRQPHSLDPAPSGSWRVLEAVGGASAWTLPPWSGLIAQRLQR
jgi:alpha-glucosidase